MRDVVARYECAFSRCDDGSSDCLLVDEDDVPTASSLPPPRRSGLKAFVAASVDPLTIYLCDRFQRQILQKRTERVDRPQL